MQETKAEKAARNVVGATHAQVIGKRKHNLGATVEGFTLYAEVELRREWWEAYPPHAPSWRTTDGRDITERFELSICGEVRDERPAWVIRAETGRSVVRADDRWISGGQCLDSFELRDGGNDLAAEIIALWRRWHLNGMRAGCVHQAKEGPRVGRKVTRYHWRLRREVSKIQDEIKREAIARLVRGETVRLEGYEAHILGLSYGVETWNASGPGPEYEPKRPLYAGDKGHTEEKDTAHLLHSEHPEGMLCRPCEVCGYKYGSAWLTEEMPPEVLARVRELVTKNPDKECCCPLVWDGSARDPEPDPKRVDRECPVHGEGAPR
jgi:hypothetical protein